MDGGFGLVIFVAVLFLGWLMWSSKTAKESVLFNGWAIMIFIVIAQALYLLFK